MERNESTARPRSRRRTWIAVALAAVAGIAVAGTATGFWGHRHGHHFDGEELRFAVEWVLRGADPSEAQVDAITAVAESAHADLTGLAERHRENREALVATFTADDVDPAAVESIRRDALELADEASARIASALVAVAEELTPGQRRELAERMGRFHHRRHGRHGHGHGDGDPE